MDTTPTKPLQVDTMGGYNAPLVPNLEGLTDVEQS